MLFSVALFSVSSAQAQSDDWTEVLIEECGVSVQMPSQPTAEQESMQFGERIFPVYIYSLNYHGVSFDFRCVQYVGPDVVLPISQAYVILESDVRANLQAENLEGFEQIKTDGYPGLNYVEAITKESKIYHRNYIIDKDTIMLSVGSFKTVPEKDRDRFLNSFKVTERQLLKQAFLDSKKTDASSVIEILLSQDIIHRDSGLEVTSQFLSDCLKSTSRSRYQLDCEDVLFIHYISFFESESDSPPIVLITQDGFSVENRWVFEIRENEYINVKDKIWPNITHKMVGDLLIQVTGESKYTEEFVLAVAHSHYRVTHTPNDVLIVSSGIPDENQMTKVGEIKWTGRDFMFGPVDN